MVIARDGSSCPPALKHTRAQTDTSRQASIEKRSSRGDKRPVSARQIKKDNNKTLFSGEGWGGGGCETIN